MARDEGWLAEHMLILKLTRPEEKAYYVAAAFPSACGKTNLAMLQPTVPGWTAETVGDDIAWMRFGEDGRLYAVNPEFGFFGVAPGTNWKTNPNAMRTIEQGNSIFTNVALTDDGDIWWEGMEGEPAAPDDWKGEDWTPESRRARRPPELAATPRRSRSARSSRPSGTTRRACRSRRSSSAAARKTTVPLVTEARDWQHGVFMGATMSSREDRRGRRAGSGQVRRDPMAMLPFLGYNVGDYFQHWIDVGKGADAAQAAEDLLRQLVPPRRRRPVPVARLRREQPRAQVGHRAHRGQGRRRRDRRSARARRPTRSTSTASTPTADGRRPPRWPSTPRSGARRSR